VKSPLRRFSLLGNFLLMGVSAVVLIAAVAAASLLTLPDVGLLEKCFTTTMYQVHLCPGSNGYVKLKNISPYVLHAVIAAEDGAFYSHKGFDWHEIRASMSANLHSGAYRRGGSTLTQQLAKNAFLDQEKSLWRKLKEAYLANAIENRYGKDFILEKYLNVVEFGKNIYGIKAASLHYFQKSPSELHPLEAAWLAMLLPNPKKYSQSYRKGHLTPYARKMVQIILKRMKAFGKLSPDAYETSLARIDQFPWTAMGMDSFSGTPGYSLESDTPASAAAAASADADLDESTLEELLKEDDEIAPPAKADLEDGDSAPAAGADSGASSAGARVDSPETEPATETPVPTDAPSDHAFN
jgi:monofunctional biosynthetic peptidoglycan transglycosylase